MSGEANLEECHSLWRKGTFETDFESGLKPSVLQDGCLQLEQVLSAHYGLQRYNVSRSLETAW